MQLLHFTKSMMESPNEELTVTVNMYSSNVIFNMPAISHVGLKKGDRIVFTQDENSGNWYFFKTGSNDSFPLRQYAASNMLAFNCKNLCKKIITSTEKDAYKVCLKITSQPVEHEEMTLYKMEMKNFERDEFFNFDHNALYKKSAEVPQATFMAASSNGQGEKLLT